MTLADGPAHPPQQFPAESLVAQAPAPLQPLAGIQALHYWPRAGQAARVLWQEIRMRRRRGELDPLRAERAVVSERLRTMAEDFAEAGTEPFNEPGRADLPVGLDAQQRVPASLKIPMRDSGIVDPPHER